MSAYANAGRLESKAPPDTARSGKGTEMDILDTLSRAFNYIKTIGVADMFDILIIAILLFGLFRIANRTHIIRVLKGILVIIFILWLSGVLGLTMINFLLRNAVELGVIALVILFQPELRRFLEKVGSNHFSGIFSAGYPMIKAETVITQTVLACADMSYSHTGALIIFSRGNHLSDPISTGTILDAAVTAELLKNIFFVKAPLHDGAVIIRDGRIAAAGCMLPMSSNMNLSKELGMRHRAGIGISEQSDAVVVIVSEETGSISVAVDGMLKRHLSTETVETLLRRELLPEDGQKARCWNLKDWVRGKIHG